VRSRPVIPTGRRSRAGWLTKPWGANVFDFLGVGILVRVISISLGGWSVWACQRTAETIAWFDTPSRVAARLLVCDLWPS